MSAEFIPFAPAARARAAANASPDTFAPLASDSPPAGIEPKVQVKRSGDRITHIQIHCRCGEMIEVECEY